MNGSDNNDRNERRGGRGFKQNREIHSRGMCREWSPGVMEQPGNTACGICTQHCKTGDRLAPTVYQVARASDDSQTEPGDVDTVAGYPGGQIWIVAEVPRVVRKVRQTRDEVQQQCRTQWPVSAYILLGARHGWQGGGPATSLCWLAAPLLNRQGSGIALTIGNRLAQ
jgi:hypothetical protein